MDNEEEYMSDDSQNTEQLNEVDEGDVYETVIKKGLDRKTTKQIKVKKSKPIPIPKKNNKKKVNKEIEEEVLEEVVNENEILEPVVKEKTISEKRLEHLAKAREAKANKLTVKKTAVKQIKRQVKKEMPLVKHTVEKTKVIYMIPTNNGFIESESIPKLTKRELNFLDNDEIVTKEEEAIGKKIIRKKNGSADGRSKRVQTEKQKEATKKMLETNRKRRESKKKETDETLGTQVKKAMIDVVTKPINELKKVEPEKPKTTQYDFSNITPFF